MKVDGGRSLTSSGFIKWEGMELMNRRFEPSTKNWWQFLSKKVTDWIADPNKRHQVGTHEWI